MNGLLSGGGYNDSLSRQAGASPYAIALKDRIASAVFQAQERLDAAKEAQEIFERNPDLEKLINAIQRGQF